MSLPRQVIPDITYLITRRTLGRQFLLRPSAEINQICDFCMGVAAQRTGLAVHNYNFLSNHYHLTATDTRGNLPQAMHWLNEYIAKCVNAHLGRWETFWAPGSYSAVKLVDRPAQIRGMVYVFTNPVSSGLVRTMKEWPGAHSTPADMERPPRIIERPRGFFREDGSVPSSIPFRLSAPTHLDMSVAEMERLVAEREEELRGQAKAKGRSFLGCRRVLEQSPFDSPRVPEQRRRLSPRVAVRDKWRRIESLQLLKRFLSDYRKALADFIAGHRDVLFPYGTYGMRVRFNVMCMGP